MTVRKTIVVTGGTGFVGTALSTRLLDEGHHVIILSRTPERVNQLFSGSVSAVASLDAIPSDQRVHAVVNLAGEPIASGRWTAAKKAALVNSRLSVTQHVVALCQRLEVKPEVVVSASAIGFYGAHPTQQFDESHAPSTCFTGRLCAQWEAAAEAVEPLGIRLCRLRLGVVLGEGGALKQMLPAFRLGLGGPIGSGQQWFSWVHLQDVIDVTSQCINTPEWTGAFNVVAPEPVTNQTLASTLGQVLRRPAKLRMPAMVVRLLFGEMGTELLVKGQYVTPKHLEQLGYTFSYDTVASALSEILG